MDETKEPEALSDSSFAKFAELTHRLTGITLGQTRKAMIQGRLRKRVVALGLGSYERYLDLAQKEASEQAIFIDLITTNETYFFRTPRIWDHIEKIFLPQWAKAHPKQVFHAWSAAASSGEEAHSLAILCQNFRDRNPDFSFQILGTDISKEMVALCEQGHYAKRSIESFRNSKPDLFLKFMKSAPDDHFQLSPDLKSRLRFRQHNLFQALSSQDRFDLVLLRNVLIYFAGPDQEKVVEKISSRLVDDGILIIGESESLSHIKTEFKHLAPLIYAKAGNEGAR